MSGIAQMLNTARRAAAASEDPATRLSRQQIAQTTLHGLQDELCQQLKSAAGEGRLVRETLTDGRWNSTVRALRGLALSHSAQADYYRALAATLEAVIPNGLDIY